MDNTFSDMFFTTFLKYSINFNEKWRELIQDIDTNIKKKLMNNNQDLITNSISMD